MRYAVVNTKGGVGKTTMACHLAAHLASVSKTLLIDGDTQESAATWAAWRRDSAQFSILPSPNTVRLKGKAISVEGLELSSAFENTVVDAGGRDAPGLRNSLLLAQLAVVPVGASDLDSAAMTDLLEVADLAKDYNPDLRVKIVLTRLDPRTKDAGKMLEFLHEMKLDVMAARIGERVAFRRAIGEGAAVHEMGKDASAIAEMAAFYEEVTAQ